MSFAPLRQCTRIGCRALVRTTDPGAPRCPAHPYPQRTFVQQKRPNKVVRGYGKDWERLREYYLCRHPICEIQARCTGNPAQEVDHVIPISQGGARLDESNLQSTCIKCHRSKTAQQRAHA